MSRTAKRMNIMKMKLFPLKAASQKESKCSRLLEQNEKIRSCVRQVATRARTLTLSTAGTHNLGVTTWSCISLCVRVVGSLAG